MKNCVLFVYWLNCLIPVLGTLNSSCGHCTLLFYMCTCLWNIHEGNNRSLYRRLISLAFIPLLTITDLPFYVSMSLYCSVSCDKPFCKVWNLKSLALYWGISSERRHLTAFGVQLTFCKRMRAYTAVHMQKNIVVHALEFSFTFREKLY